MSSAAVTSTAWTAEGCPTTRLRAPHQGVGEGTPATPPRTYGTRAKRPTAAAIVNPLCAGEGSLFTSAHPADHAEAKDLCRGCGGRAECLALGFAEPCADGTYGGVLFVNGERRTS